MDAYQMVYIILKSIPNFYFFLKITIIEHSFILFGIKDYIVKLRLTMKSKIYATKATLCLESSIPSGHGHFVTYDALREHMWLTINNAGQFVFSMFRLQKDKSRTGINPFEMTDKDLSLSH